MEREQMEQRKQMLERLINDKAYVPMKAKEIAMLLDIPKSQRGELAEVLDSLVAEGKIRGILKKAKIRGSRKHFSVNGTFFRATPRASAL